MRQVIFGLLTALLVAATSHAMAADLAYGSYGQQCVGFGDSGLASLPPAEIEVEVTEHFVVAKAAMSEPGIVASRRPAFTWAYETRIACGKAIGYLMSSHIDVESVQKCDCFYRRFLSFR